MGTEELDYQFDILYNSITSNQAPGLDSYEKSVILTKAQDDLLKAYFLPQRNKSQTGFDSTGERQIDFSTVIRTTCYTEFLAPTMDNKSNTKRVSLEDNIFTILNEFVDVDRQGTSVRLSVVPISYLEYSLYSSKPHKRPYKNQAWRLINDVDHTVEIIVGPGDTIENYTVRYVKRPRAIILEDLEDGLTIDGSSTRQECELDPSMHEELLQRAVEIAKGIYMGTLESQLALGLSSQTDKGILTQSK